MTTWPAQDASQLPPIPSNSELEYRRVRRPPARAQRGESAPRADVVVMGHVGFPTGLREVWRLLPERQTIQIRLWHEPAGSLPADRDEQIDWLFGWWRTLDRWVAERHASVA